MFFKKFYFSSRKELPLLLFPSLKPLFPGSTMIMTIPSDFHAACNRLNIRNIAVSPLKETNESSITMKKFLEKDLEIFSSEEETLPVKKKDSFLESMMKIPQNIIYAQSDAAKDIPFANESSLNGIATFCSTAFAKDGNSYLAIFRGEKRISLKERLVDGSLAVYDWENFKNTGMLNEDLLNHLYMLSKRIGQMMPVNFPTYLENNQPSDFIDLMLGFLATVSNTPFQTLMEAFNEPSLQKRAFLTKDLLENFEKETAKALQIIKEDSPKNTQNDGVKEIYNYLKKINSSSTLSSPSLQRLHESFSQNKLRFPKAISNVIVEELNELSELGTNHPEYSSKINLLEILLDLPYGIKTEENFDLEVAKAILDSDHYGMQKVKDRILEFLAVGKLRGSLKGKTLLLDGPPGVGKTSIASSIAKCLGRKFARISLGGESDVAIIKGHRRTYIGSYPGKIVQAMRSAGSENPVILLDEIDKIGKGFRGSLYDSLLEILDPSQNHSFVDNFLELPIDLSNVLFIGSSNLAENIPEPLLDRMEFISMSGYSLHEKIEIAKRHVLPSVKNSTGIGERLIISDEALKALINGYARESGMRGLQKSLKRLAEKASLKCLSSDSCTPSVITPANLRDWLGKPKFSSQNLYSKMIPGIAAGLGFNSFGGSVLFIEAVESEAVPAGSLKLTGSLGKVMQESIQIAYSYAKFLCSELIGSDALEKKGIHIHFPSGSTPKDGPSAGTAITTALLSLGLNVPIPEGIAMTGEVTLTGKVLPVGGVKEKVLAARREGFKTVFLPKNCETEGLEGITDVEIKEIEKYEEVYKFVFKQILKSEDQIAEKNNFERETSINN